jgi:hypothetical protein
MARRPGMIALAASTLTLACTVPTEGWNPKPTPIVAASSVNTPTPNVISDPQVALADVMVGVWCTPSVESMVGTSMQWLSLAPEGTFNLGVVVNANVDPKSIRSRPSTTPASYSGRAVPPSRSCALPEMPVDRA